MKAAAGPGFFDAPRPDSYSRDSMAPRKPADETREKFQVRVRLLEDEQKQLDDAAKQLGIPTATWARAVLLREARKVLGIKEG
jgi:hypothetical protein